MLQGCEIFTFPCNRWLARDEEDGAIERELIPDKIVTETTRRDGSLKRKEKDNRHGLTGWYLSFILLFQCFPISDKTVLMLVIKNSEHST